jgi:hypothetical protein
MIDRANLNSSVLRCLLVGLFQDRCFWLDTPADGLAGWAL